MQEIREHGGFEYRILKCNFPAKGCFEKTNPISQRIKGAKAHRHKIGKIGLHFVPVCLCTWEQFEKTNPIYRLREGIFLKSRRTVPIFILGSKGVGTPLRIRYPVTGRLIVELERIYPTFAGEPEVARGKKWSHFAASRVYWRTVSRKQGNRTEVT